MGKHNVLWETSVVKILCNICHFQELSEDAKVLVDAYGENSRAKIVFLKGFFSLMQVFREGKQP